MNAVAVGVVDPRPVPAKTIALLNRKIPRRKEGRHASQQCNRRTTLPLHV